MIREKEAIRIAELEEELDLITDNRWTARNIKHIKTEVKNLSQKFKIAELQRKIDDLWKDNAFMDEALDASIKDTKYFEEKYEELKESIKPSEYYSVLGSEYRKYLEWRGNE